MLVSAGETDLNHEQEHWHDDSIDFSSGTRGDDYGHQIRAVSQADEFRS